MCHFAFLLFHAAVLLLCSLTRFLCQCNTNCSKCIAHLFRPVSSPFPCRSVRSAPFFDVSFAYTFLHFHLISSCDFICLITSALCTSHLSFVSVLSACEWRWCAPQDCWRGVECSALLQRNGTFERKQLLV